jgi:hypothetical protein
LRFIIHGVLDAGKTSRSPKILHEGTFGKHAQNHVGE